MYVRNNFDKSKKKREYSKKFAALCLMTNRKKLKNRPPPFDFSEKISQRTDWRLVHIVISRKGSQCARSVKKLEPRRCQHCQLERSGRKLSKSVMNPRPLCRRQNASEVNPKELPNPDQSTETAFFPCNFSRRTASIIPGRKENIQMRKRIYC